MRGGAFVKTPPTLAWGSQVVVTEARVRFTLHHGF
jgi:hypothetical protein